jgi:glutamyl-tRNA reductase
MKPFWPELLANRRLLGCHERLPYARNVYTETDLVAAQCRTPASRARHSSMPIKIRVVGCSHHTAPIAIRERLAFGAADVKDALSRLHRQFPAVEAVLLSTCNRVELYAASADDAAPTCRQWVEFLAGFHDVAADRILAHTYVREDFAAIRHLFLVASSLDSMVVGEPQILAQVKQAYRAAAQQQAAGPMIHGMFQTALKTARRVASETRLHQHRVSISSVAVADVAAQIFERFDDKQTLVIGAGEMAEETLKYLRQQGTVRITVVNRHADRAEALATRWQGQVAPWEQLPQALAAADLVISATGAQTVLITLSQFLGIEPARRGRPLLILDLAVPRDIDPAIGERSGVYLYSIDDLKAACDRNKRARDNELPAALRIVEEESERFSASMCQRTVAPTILRLQRSWHGPKETELDRLFGKLPQLNDRARHEIRQSFDRLVGKLLHPPLQSLREESRDGVPSDLLDAVDTLFQLKKSA